MKTTGTSTRAVYSPRFECHSPLQTRETQIFQLHRSAIINSSVSVSIVRSHVVDYSTSVVECSATHVAQVGLAHLMRGL